MLFLLFNRLEAYASSSSTLLAVWVSVAWAGRLVAIPHCQSTRCRTESSLHFPCYKGEYHSQVDWILAQLERSFKGWNRWDTTATGHWGELVWSLACSNIPSYPKYAMDVFLFLGRNSKDLHRSGHAALSRYPTPSSYGPLVWVKLSEQGRWCPLSF